jgi:hypothetical protein
LHDPITSLVVTLFSTPGVALQLAGALLAFAVALIVVSSFTEYRPLVKALVDRWNLLAATRGPQGRILFMERFAEIDLRFGAASAAPAALVLGWANYRSLLVDTTEGGFASSARASEAFDRLDEPARSLEWWANILVAMGLVITFLGIVAALTEATSAIGAASGGGAASSNAVQAALLGLLAIAATKFWTSIAGVLASIILRVVARLRRKRIERLEANFFESLDACVQFAPPEKVALEQLKSLNRVEAALERLASPRA